MTLHSGPEGAPDPEVLAAYFDGELEGRDELRRQVEDWLALHPDSEADPDRQRLRELWQETTPPEPSGEAWQRVLEHVAMARGTAVPVRQRRWPVALAAAACVALFVGLASWLLQPAPHRLLVEEKAQQLVVVEVFPVATAEEVVILRVDGDDRWMLPIGQFPLHGPLVLADAGEVERISSEPDALDQMVPQFRWRGPQRPMVWAPLDAEEMPR
jgi:hypothetical protein